MQQMRREDPRVSRTCVFFHAHPDDEALLTGGTMAGLAAQGHRVVLVVATAGENGLSETSVASRLGKVRAAELDASAAVLGCARVHHLGYADSGLDGRAAPCPGSPPPFAQVPVSEAAAALAGILREEHADLITGYDAAAATATQITCRSTTWPPKRHDSRESRCCWRPPWTAPCCYAPSA